MKTPMFAIRMTVRRCFGGGYARSALLPLFFTSEGRALTCAGQLDEHQMSGDDPQDPRHSTYVTFTVERDLRHRKGQKEDVQ